MSQSETSRDIFLTKNTNHKIQIFCHRIAALCSPTLGPGKPRTLCQQQGLLFAEVFLQKLLHLLQLVPRLVFWGDSSDELWILASFWG